MSAQAGIFYRDLRPVPDEVLATLWRFNHALAPDRDGRYVADGIALLSFAWHFDNLATREHQPVRRSDASVLTWDGRLDNRADFIARLDRDLEGDYTDATIVATALQKWPEDTLDRLLGDWSLVRWDSARRELTLARDYVGNRALYYCCRPDYFVWSTSQEALVVICDLVGKVNERYLVGQVTGSRPENETWYEGLLNVPAGCCLRVDSSLSLHPTSYFSFKPVTTRFRDQRDYGDRYRELLTEAVSVRLRARSTVWTELSGGYDSSSITCLASSLVSAGSVAAPGLQLLSRVMPDSPESDESPYIEIVEQWCRRRAFRLNVGIPFAFRLPPSVVDLQRSGVSPSAWNQDESTLTEPPRVLLSGELGDVVAGDVSTSAVLIDRLKMEGVRRFVADSIGYCRYDRTFLLLLWWQVLKAAVFPDRGGALSDARRFAAIAKERRLSTYVGPTELFGLREDLLQRVSSSPKQPRDLSALPARARVVSGEVVGFATAGILSAYSSGPNRRTHPFSHRPLVTYVGSLPPSALAPQVGTRAFVRSALCDVLPIGVLNRINKGDATPIATRMYRSAVMEALENDSLRGWDLVTNGYGEPFALRKILAGFLDGSQPTAMSVGGLLEAEHALRQIARVPTASRRLTDTAGIA